MSTTAETVVPIDVDMPAALRAAIEASPRVVIPATRSELYQLALGPDGGPVFSVDYEANGSTVTEATVTRCRNGIAVNYPEDYMRRRDPQCMLIADERPTDKDRYLDRFGETFDGVKQETLDWLATQELVVVPFKAGGLTFDNFAAAWRAMVPQQISFCPRPCRIACIKFGACRSVLAWLRLWLQMEKYFSSRARAKKNSFRVMT